MRRTRKPRLGPTQTFPDGKSSPDDEGALNVALGINMDNKTIEVHFGTMVSWIGFDAEGAMEFANRLLDSVANLRRLK